MFDSGLCVYSNFQHIRGNILTWKNLVFLSDLKYFMSLISFYFIFLFLFHILPEITYSARHISASITPLYPAAFNFRQFYSNCTPLYPTAFNLLKISLKIANPSSSHSQIAKNSFSKSWKNLGETSFIGTGKDQQKKYMDFYTFWFLWLCFNLPELNNNFYIQNLKQYVIWSVPYI